MVKVKSSRTDLDNETEIIELTSPGSFYKRGDSYYIIYKETAVTGMENATTSIKVQGRVITLVRSGSVNNRQVFELGKLHRSCYQTSFGNLDMAVKPWNIEVDLTDLGGSIKLEYELELNHAKVGRNSLDIHIKEDKPVARIGGDH
ncbi:DUF1934 domain-containing protein [Desulforamulus aquiferis]|uniref:DUF1934 domain-containing protein n=1 Tax=Desulforamulus aquiferis TaxID=1397668 RepID=UPI0027154638|nr:DUF1934 domain-containing protein [Desulforamulus aquiferis]